MERESHIERSEALVRSRVGLVGVSRVEEEGDGRFREGGEEDLTDERVCV